MASQSTCPIKRTVSKDRPSAHPSASRPCASLDTHAPIAPEPYTNDPDATIASGIDTHESGIVGNDVNAETDADTDGMSAENDPEDGPEDDPEDGTDSDIVSEDAWWSSPFAFEGIYMSITNKTPATILMADGDWFIGKWSMDEDTCWSCQTWPGEPGEVNAATTYPVYVFEVRYPMNETADEMLHDDGNEGLVVDVVGPIHWLTAEEVHNILIEAREPVVASEEMA